MYVNAYDLKRNLYAHGSNGRVVLSNTASGLILESSTHIHARTIISAVASGFVPDDYKVVTDLAEIYYHFPKEVTFSQDKMINVLFEKDQIRCYHEGFDVKLGSRTSGQTYITGPTTNVEFRAYHSNFKTDFNYVRRAKAKGWLSEEKYPTTGIFVGGRSSTKYITKMIAIDQHRLHRTEPLHYPSSQGDTYSLIVDHQIDPLTRFLAIRLVDHTYHNPENWVYLEGTYISLQIPVLAVNQNLDTYPQTSPQLKVIPDLQALRKLLKPLRRPILIKADHPSMVIIYEIAEHSTQEATIPTTRIYGDGTGIHVEVNPRYLLDAITGIREATMEFHSSTTPIVIQSDIGTAVIMPLDPTKSRRSNARKN